MSINSRILVGCFILWLIVAIPGFAQSNNPVAAPQATITSNKGNLYGTIRTLDGVHNAVPLEPGLLSRNGWVLVDDTERPLFDNSDWPWVTPRSPCEAQRRNMEDRNFSGARPVSQHAHRARL